MVTAWRMRTELGMKIAQGLYLYLVQKYPQGSENHCYHNYKYNNNSFLMVKEIL